MAVPMWRILKATLIAGLVPGFLAPVLWPLVVFLVEGHFPDWEIYPMGALAIAFFATLTGILMSVGLGFPALLCLERAKSNKPLVAAGVGFILGLTAFWLVGPSLSQAPLAESWPVHLFPGLLGATCGFLASRLSHPERRA